MPDVVREPHAAHGPLAIHAVQDAARALLARRHAQRAGPTFGDEADHALLAALRGIPVQDLALARGPLASAGESVGRQVIARRCYEDSVPGAMAILSSTLLASGWGSLEVEQWFHRQGILRLAPTPALAEAGDAAGPFLVGLLEGYLGEVFNCRATATPAGARRFEVRLLEGRDVNRRRSP